MVAGQDGSGPRLWVTLCNDFSSPSLCFLSVKLEEMNSMTRGVDEMQECQTQAFSEHAENQVLFAVIDFHLKINF